MSGDKFLSDEIFYIDERSVDHKWNMGDFHYHSSYEIYYLSKGGRKMLVGDRVYELFPGDVILLPPNALHRSMHSGPHTRINIVFTDRYLSEYFSSAAAEYLTSCFDTEFIRLSQEENQLFINFFAGLSKNYKSKRNCFIALAEILDLFADAAERQKNNPLPRKSYFSNVSPKTDSVIEYLCENYGTISTIDEIADSCYINKSYMCRLFKKETGVTIFEYLNNIRINHACELLRSTPKSVTDIAAECGFSGISYFSRVFKANMECTPLTFRNRRL